MKRIKRRYLALQLDIAVDGLPSERELIESIWGAITQIYGEYGASQANLVLINFDVEHKLSIVRVNLPMLNNLRTSIATITQIANKPAAIHVLSVSGTIKALTKQLQTRVAD
jgi:RNase P/RNase MRP subunit POP5